MLTLITRAWRVHTTWLAIALILSLSAYFKGHSDGIHTERKAEAQRLAKAQAKVAKRERAADKITTKVATQLETQKVEIRWRTRTITERIPVYVPQAADARCVVPRGFVLLHDAAAQGSAPSLSSAPGGSVEAPSGIDLSAVAETVTQNYGTAYEWRAEAQAWRDWYARQRAEWEKR